MSINSKISNIIKSHPVFVILVIGFTITMTVSSAIGLISTTDALSSGSGGMCYSLEVIHTSHGIIIHRCMH